MTETFEMVSERLITQRYVGSSAVKRVSGVKEQSRRANPGRTLICITDVSIFNPHWKRLTMTETEIRIWFLEKHHHAE